MKLTLYSDAALTRDLPEYRLRCGDVVKIVDHHTAPNGKAGYSIEVLNALGDTLAVTTVSEFDLEPLREDEVLSARSLNAV